MCPAAPLSASQNASIIEGLRSLKQELQDSLDPETLRSKADELEKLTQQENFWQSENSQEVLKELSRAQDDIRSWENMDGEFSELALLEEMLREYDDPELQSELENRAAVLHKALDHQQLFLLLNEEYDRNNAILTIHAGSGGLDSQDWAGMLLRMYLRWAERENFKARAIDIQSDDEAGIKSATLEINGSFAHGYLKAEKGVHRLVRISPFDSAKRRHTSFASVSVYPELPDDLDLDIRPEDLKIDTFRSSGAGGQHVNRTDSAVRITHLPTGIITSCQNERSQHMNKDVAMKVLRSKLYEKAVQEREKELAAVVGDKKESSWGSQIRSYVLDDRRVKDTRTGYETSNTEAVLNGDIKAFVKAYLLSQ
ncbi:MAG: peptide chain release factor 2 [Synergistaceae bacterium]|nr:peptide chain release factor 2 [Synergistaceae bacterium]